MSLQSILSRFVRHNFWRHASITKLVTVFHYSSVKALHQYVNGVSLESNISLLQSLGKTLSLYGHLGDGCMGQ